ncbi:MAG: UvrD-helicase domain-containing protein [Caloramator sp.]|nr:UvrD-helicase domain-containing protein [Caloramator sp.]
MDLNYIKEVYEVNDEQAKALEINKNIALHAGAGSGKTRVLTRRFLRVLLEENCGLDDIVAITFTKKAALEMKERILDLVNQFLMKSDDGLKNKLKRIKENLDGANISTFHSFCDSIVREYYYKIGLEPMYQIIEEVDSETILSKLTSEIIEEFLKDERYFENFNFLFDEFGVDYVLSGGFAFETRKIYKKIREKADDIETKVRQKTFNNLVEFYGGSDENLKKYQKIEVLLLELISELHKRYSDFKLQEGLVDFNDLEIFTLNLLTEHREVRDALRKRYKYFLVDEFQDTNDIQLKILYNLVADDEGKIQNGKLFVVGDIKQSIYGFRGTNYKVFEEVTEKIQKNGDKLLLSTNYRSHNRLVEIINGLFSGLLPNYDPLFYSSNIDGEALFDYCFFEKAEETTTGQRSNEAEAIKKKLKSEKVTLDELKVFCEIDETINLRGRNEELSYIVKKIKELIEKGFEYKEIAILLRDRNNIDEFEREFKKNNIPYTLVGGIGYFERQEILDIINIIKYFYNPNDEVALLGLLRSPYVGISDDLVIEILDEIRNGNDMAKISEREVFDDVTKLILKKIDNIKNLVPFYTTTKLVKTVIEEFKIKEILLAQEEGIQKYRNIEKFVEIVRDFDSKGIFTPFDFIDYINNLRAISTKEGEAFLDTEESDAVKIMTIHASKGLEFEVVFVPGLDRKIKKEYKGNFIYDDKFGIIVKHEFNDIEDNLFKKIKQRIEDEECYEELRILYVAATRAVRVLAFSGYIKDEKTLTYISKLTERNLDEYKNLTSQFRNYKKLKEKVISHEGEDRAELWQKLNFKIDFSSRTTVSISRYMTYKDCPRKYYFKYIAKIDQDDLLDDYDDLNEKEGIKLINSRKKGTLIHSILEELTKNEGCNIQNKIKDILGTESQELEEEIERYIDNFIKIEKEYKSLCSGYKVKSDAELRFKIPLPNSSLSIFGIIDRVDVFSVGDGLNVNIIDYKTNKVTKDEDIKKLIDHYKSQFIIYSYAYTRFLNNLSLGLREVNNYLYLLDVGEIVRIDYSQEDLDYVINDIKSIFSNIEKLSFDDFKSYGCTKNCKYNVFCRLK